MWIYVGDKIGREPFPHVQPRDLEDLEMLEQEAAYRAAFGAGAPEDVIRASGLYEWAEGSLPPREPRQDAAEGAGEDNQAAGDGDSDGGDAGQTEEA